MWVKGGDVDNSNYDILAFGSQGQLTAPSELSSPLPMQNLYLGL